MTTSTEITKGAGDKQDVTTLKELMELLKAGTLPQGFIAPPALLEEMEQRTKVPTVEEAIALFESIEEKFPRNTLGEDKWYLVAVSLPKLLFKAAC